MKNGHRTSISPYLGLRDMGNHCPISGTDQQTFLEDRNRQRHSVSSHAHDKCKPLSPCIFFSSSFKVVQFSITGSPRVKTRGQNLCC